MKKLFLIVYGVIMFITVIVSVYLYMNQTPVAISDIQNTTSSPENLGPLYAYSPNGEQGPLIDPAKSAVSINTETGVTILAAQPNYLIEYFRGENTFIITLLGNNLRESRVAAETDFLARFQITKEQACSLNVLVGTIPSVSQRFAAQELGRSFCPGMVDLPTESLDPLEADASTGFQPDIKL